MPRANKSSQGKALLFAGCAGVLLAAGGIIYFMNAPDAKSVAAQSVATASTKPPAANCQTGTVLVPDGQGTCHKYAYGNDSGKAAYLGTAPCDQAPPKEGRASLPPALRGMQENLKR